MTFPKLDIVGIPLKSGSAGRHLLCCLIMIVLVSLIDVSRTHDLSWPTSPVEQPLYRTHIDCSLWPPGAAPLERTLGSSLWTLPCQNSVSKPSTRTTYIFELHKNAAPLSTTTTTTTTRRPWFWKRWLGRKSSLVNPLIAPRVQHGGSFLKQRMYQLTLENNDPQWSVSNCWQCFN